MNAWTSRSRIVGAVAATLLMAGAAPAGAQARAEPPVAKQQQVTRQERMRTPRADLRTGVVPAKCEDARALAAQIRSGGPTDRMVYNPRLSSLDASRGLESPPFEPRMQPRPQAQLKAMANGTYRRHGGEGEIARAMNAMQMPRDPTMPPFPGC